MLFFQGHMIRKMYAKYSGNSFSTFWMVVNLFLYVPFWKKLIGGQRDSRLLTILHERSCNVDITQSGALKVTHFECITWQTAGHAWSTQWHPVWSSNLKHILKIILLFYGYWLHSCFPQCLFKEEEQLELRAKIMCPGCTSVHLHSVRWWLPLTLNGLVNFELVPNIQNNGLKLRRWMSCSSFVQNAALD